MQYQPALVPHSTKQGERNADVHRPTTVTASGLQLLQAATLQVWLQHWHGAGLPVGRRRSRACSKLQQVHCVAGARDRTRGEDDAHVLLALLQGSVQDAHCSADACTTHIRDGAH